MDIVRFQVQYKIVLLKFCCLNSEKDVRAMRLDSAVMSKFISLDSSESNQTDGEIFCQCSKEHFFHYFYSEPSSDSTRTRVEMFVSFVFEREQKKNILKILKLITLKQLSFNQLNLCVN